MGTSVVASLVVSHQSNQNIISISSLLVVDTDALPSVKCQLEFQYVVILLGEASTAFAEDLGCKTFWSFYGAFFS